MIFPGWEALLIDNERETWVLLPTRGDGAYYHWEMDMQLKPIPDSLMRVSYPSWELDR